MYRRSLRSLTAAWLVLLLGLLHTGLPSHSHETERPADPGDGPVLRADQHAHGTLLVEQDERVQSSPLHLAAAPTVIEWLTPPVARALAAPRPAPLRPMERAPPPGAPLYL